MMLLVAVLIALAVVLWPLGRPAPRSAWPGEGRSRSGGSPVVQKLRELGGREVRFGGRGRVRQVRPGWVADFAELAAVGLDAGLPSAEAAQLACAVSKTGGHPEVSALAARLASVQETGGGVGDCLAEAAGADPDLVFLSAAWRLTDEFGVAAAPAARTAADVLRERSASDDRRTVLAAGPRASMWLLTLLPLSGPLVALLLGLPVEEVYGGGPALFAAGVGLTLTTMGWLWSRRLLHRALRPAEVG